MKPCLLGPQAAAARGGGRSPECSVHAIFLGGQARGVRCSPAPQRAPACLGGQGAVEYMVILAAVLLVGLAAIAAVTYVYPGIAGISEAESAAYWSGQTSPLHILEAQFGGGLSCGSGNSSGYKLLLENSDSRTITVRNVTMNGVQRQFCVAGGSAGAVDVSPGQKRTINVLIGANCTAGSPIESSVSFLYDKAPFTGRVQDGARKLVARCSGANLSSEAGQGGVSGGFQLSVLTGNPLPSARAGDPYFAQLSAIGGAPPYSWSATGLPPGLSMSQSGAISGMPPANSSGAYSVGVAVSDNASRSAGATLTLGVAAIPAGQLTITTSSLPNAVVGVQYSQAFSASGGSGSRSWSASGLSPGLSMGASGTLSGKPAAGSAGNYTVHATVTDSTGSASTNPDIIFTVLPAGSLAITTLSLHAGRVAESYAEQLSFANGAAPYSWTCSNLPVGLNCSPSSGQITGIPAYGSDGNYSVHVVLQDSTPSSASTDLALAISPPASGPLAIATTYLANATAGQPYAASLVATGGTGAYSWNVTGLPFNLSASSIGLISGTPANGTGGQVFSVSATVYDGSSSALANLALNVTSQ